MSKKILSLVLAVLMLFSVCSVASSAAVAAGKEIGIRLESDAVVGAPAGTIVTVKFYYDLPEGVDELQMAIGNIALGYNSAAYLPNKVSGNTATEARTWGDAYAAYFKSTSAVTVSAAISSQITAKFNANDTAKGWDKALQVAQNYDTAAASASTGFPCTSGAMVFSMEFVAQRTLTAEDVIGVVDGAYNNGNFCKVCYWDGTTVAKVFAKDVVDMSGMVAAPAAPAYDVYNLKGKTGAVADKHSNGDGTSTVAVFYGFDFNPAFNANGTSEFISAISAKVTAAAGGQSITVTSDPIKYVYKVGEGYGFRVILKNVPDNADITVVPSVTTDGTAYNVETVSFNVSEAAAQ